MARYGDLHSRAGEPVARSVSVALASLLNPAWQVRRTSFLQSTEGTALPTHPRQRVSHHVFAFAWGMCEATVFFVVPDVLITRAALGSLRSGLISAAFALAGALVGGTISYVWGATDLGGARHVLDALPAISIGMLDHAKAPISYQGRR